MSKIPALAGLEEVMKINNPLSHPFRSTLRLSTGKTHYSIIPLFQHSNWGEAPILAQPIISRNRVTGS